ncbi:general secretion pathway protein GspE, partial [Salmonella enterica subsp. enterica serovar Enteritidis]
MYELNEKELDMRFSTISNFRSNESLVIRLLDKKQQKSSESRSFFKKELKELTKLVQYKSGLIL